MMRGDSDLADVSAPVRVLLVADMESGTGMDVTGTDAGADALRRLAALLAAGLTMDEALDDVLFDGANSWDDVRLAGDTLLVAEVESVTWEGWPDAESLNEKEL